MKKHLKDGNIWNKVVEGFHKFFFVLISTGILASGASFTCPSGRKGDEPPAEAPTARYGEELDVKGVPVAPTQVPSEPAAPTPPPPPPVDSTPPSPTNQSPGE
jgi:type IV secretory pathway VirB10-like protein